MNALKRSLFTLALIAGVSSSALLAQPPEGGPGPGGPAGERRGGPGMQMSAEDRLKWLGEQLGITEEQKTQLKPIITEEVAALKAVWEDKSLDRPAQREKMKAVRESFASKIEAILTPDQKAKFEKLKAMRGPGGPGGGPRKEREEKK
jgi:protein CpxP